MGGITGIIIIYGLYTIPLTEAAVYINFSIALIFSGHNAFKPAYKRAEQIIVIVRIPALQGSRSLELSVILIHKSNQMSRYWAAFVPP